MHVVMESEKLLVFATRRRCVPLLGPETWRWKEQRNVDMQRMKTLEWRKEITRAQESNNARGWS